MTTQEIPELQGANSEKTKAELRHIRLSASSDRTKKNLKYIDIDVKASSSLSSLCERV